MDYVGNEVPNERETRKKDLIAFWIFGLCNNYGYVVMLTAAMDIINSGNITNEKHSLTGRHCTPLSTGAILLADIIPSFVIKAISPFLPYNAKRRVTISCLTSIASFLAVAFAQSRKIVILGVAFTSFASGLGEPTFLAHSALYNENVVSTWSSGTGGAGVIGALSYSIMREMGLSSQQTLIIMLLVPLLELFTFFFVLTKPNVTLSHYVQVIEEEEEPLMNEPQHETTNSPLVTISQKLSYIPDLMIYYIPLLLVYFFEYYINQGLYELITFPGMALSVADQYRWYQVTYQIGVFLSRSSVNLFQIKRTWLMAFAQGLLACFFLSEAILLFTPTISIIFLLIFVEGLQGGLAYVNTYHSMSRDIPPSHKQFAMNVVASSDSIGIILAGFAAIPTHNWICQLPGEAAA